MRVRKEVTNFNIMSVKGIIVDENNKMIRQEGKVYCQVDFGNGNVRNQFVEEEFLQLSSEAVAGGSGFQKEDGAYDMQSEEIEQKDREFQWKSPMIKLLIETYKTVKQDGGKELNCKSIYGKKLPI